MATLNLDRAAVRVYRTRRAWAAAAVEHHGNQCQWCRSGKDCEAQHLVPPARGGLRNILNSIVLCFNCRESTSIFELVSQLSKKVIYILCGCAELAHANDIDEILFDFI